MAQTTRVCPARIADTRWHCLSANLFAVCLSVLSFASSLEAQATRAEPVERGVAVSGFVVSDGRLISGAEVTVVGTPLITHSDANGLFRFPDVAPGQRVIQVRAIGFVAKDFPLDLRGKEDRRVVLTLPKAPQQLPDLEIVRSADKPQRYAHTSKFDLFFARKAQGIGTFITREEIDKRFKSRTQELLQTIPGVLVRQHGTQWWIQFQRCGRSKIPGSATAGKESELVEVFVDGQFSPDGTDRLETITPAEIEAIEIYKGPAQLPADARGRGCGAIYVWLREGS
ncbi:MAG: carboxypeptidase regulatory-like domain-containing protein [Gemmatimonadaceae bacterium]|nr:carboxypeptidase regulatory-like domain-containing protein [Gemmatimonadaceae bacterium]